MGYVEVTCVCCEETFLAKNNHILPSHCKKTECQAFKRKKSIERIRQRHHHHMLPLRRINRFRRGHRGPAHGLLPVMLLRQGLAALPRQA